MTEQELDKIYEQLIDTVKDLEHIDAVMIILHTAFHMFTTFELFNNRDDPNVVEQNLVGAYRTYRKSNPIPPINKVIQ